MPLGLVRKKDVFCFGKKDVSDVRSGGKAFFVLEGRMSLMSGPKEKLFLRSHFCFGKNAVPLFMIVSEMRLPLRLCPKGETVFCNPDFVSEKGFRAPVIHQASF